MVRSLVTGWGVTVLVLVAACGSSSPTPGPTPRPPTPIPTTSGPSLTVSDSSGFQFQLSQGAAGTATTQPSSSQATPPPPGQDYITIPLQVTNVQTDRPAPFDAILENVGANVPASVAQASTGGCLTAKGLPAGQCEGTIEEGVVDIFFADGFDLGDEALTGAGSTIAPGATDRVVAYVGPVASSLSPSSVALSFVDGTKPLQPIPLNSSSPNLGG